MSYHIRSMAFGHTIIHQLYELEHGEAVEILPAYGGQLHQLYFNHKGKRLALLESYSSSSMLNSEEDMDYKGAKLSPFPNRLAGGSYRYRENQYHLNCNDKGKNALHGFLWNYPLTLKDVELNKESASLVLGVFYEGKKEGYPFPFQMDVTYTLSKGNLMVKTRVENKGKTAMPLGDGWHPYFVTPGGVEGWQMQLPTTHRLKTDSFLIPTGEQEKYSTFASLSAIQSARLDHCFGPLEENFSETILYQPREELKIVVWQKSGAGQYEWLNVYIPPERNSIAIEPMSCAPNAFNNGMGNVQLEVGESKTYTFGVKIE